MITGNSHGSSTHIIPSENPVTFAKSEFSKKGYKSLYDAYSMRRFYSNISQPLMVSFWLRVYHNLLRLIEPKEKVYFKKKNQKPRKREFIKIIYRDQNRG